MSDTRILTIALIALLAFGGPLMMLAMWGGCHV